MGKPEKKLKKIILILGITGAVYGSFRFLLPLVIPFLLAWGLAVLLRPSAQWIAGHCRVRIPRGIVTRWFASRAGGKPGPPGVKAGEYYIGIPVGVAGVLELLVITAAVSVGIYLGGRKLCLEASLFINRIPEWVGILDTWLTAVCHDMEDIFCLKANVLVVLMREMLKGLMGSIKNAAMPYVMVNSVSVFKWGIGISVILVVVLVSVGLCLQEMDRWKKRCAMSIYNREYALIGRRLAIVANAYLKTQGIIMMLTAAICTVGFWLLGNPYYILAGVGIGILDALPVFGTGTVLIPWAVVMFFSGRWGRGIMLLALYLICYFLREILEAKLMGDRVGLSPLETLMSMYVGLELFGIVGFLLGPVGLLLIKDLVEALE